MSDSLIMPKKRTAQMLGDPVESRRLHPLFHALCGKRPPKMVFAELGITDANLRNADGWLHSPLLRILSDANQRVVRRALDQSGIVVSPCN